MRLCVTEKKSVAADIARIVGANSQRDGYFEGDGIRVTWTIGHLCCLYEPHDYTPAWKQWALSRLPMLPEKYDIKVIDDAGIKRQFGVVQRLMSEADEIVNCGDAGQEGELIQRWVMKKAGAHCPVQRLWISSMTDESIREGFASLKPEASYDKLFYAGLCRAIGDWILGMNATRLFTLKYAPKGTVLSIGRVQTPTLALIVARQREIDNFVPSDSWELHTKYRDVDFTAGIDRFPTESEGNEAVERIRPELLVIDDVSKNKGREAPPRLFDLTSLQVECNKKFGWTAADTLARIQSLYEKKLTTYPRVDTTYLPDDVYPKIAPTLRAMTPYAKYTQPVLEAPITKSKKIFDNSKVTDHHAIIPTGQSPVGLQGEEKTLYHLIAMRFIAAFYADCVFEGTTVSAHAGKTPFKATGRVIISEGWRALYPKKDKDNSEESTLPVFKTGESGPHEPFLAKKTSQPPKPFTEGTLLRAMETAGRTIDDETLREAMKENGIGRPSTRAAIIETLFKRRYITRRQKALQPTQAGIDLIDTISEELLKSARLTGIWENKLRRIERGEYSPAEFIREITALIRQIVSNVLNDNISRRIGPEPEEAPKAPSPKGSASPGASHPSKLRAPRITRLDQVRCPLCGEGHIVKGRTAFGCSRYAQGCRFLLPFTQMPEDSKPSAINKKINH